jgi:hypothetical protein
MCMALFLAAAEPLPIIPWSEADRSFNVQLLSESEQVVRRHFTKPNVYYLGAHTGCSCGFSYGQMRLVNAEDQIEDASARRSVAALRQYLDEAVRRLGEVELFSSWEGDWAEEVESSLEVSPEWFGGESFKLPEKVAFRVTSSPSNKRLHPPPADET